MPWQCTSIRRSKPSAALVPVTVAAEPEVPKMVESSTPASAPPCAGSVTIEFPGNENSGGKDLDFGLLSSVAGDFEVMQGDRQAARRSKVYGCGTDADVHGGHLNIVTGDMFEEVGDVPHHKIRETLSQVNSIVFHSQLAHHSKNGGAYIGELGMDMHGVVRYTL